MSIEVNKQRIIELIPLNEYLKGNPDYYLTNINLNNELQEIIDFEKMVQIMVELNDRFKFEKDNIFTNEKEFIELFNNYKHIFCNFQILKYTILKVREFKENAKAECESLYQALIEADTIKDNKENFIKFLLEVHNIKMSKIRVYKSKSINYSHDDRVKKYLGEIASLTS